MNTMTISDFQKLVSDSLPGAKYAFAIWDEQAGKTRSYSLNGAKTGVGEDGVIRFGLTEVDNT